MRTDRGQNNKAEVKPMEDKREKALRVLEIYAKLFSGNMVNKREEALRYGVNERSIQRDIEDIRSFLNVAMDRAGGVGTVVYDRAGKGYRMEQSCRLRLSGSDVAEFMSGSAGNDENRRSSPV